MGSPRFLLWARQQPAGYHVKDNLMRRMLVAIIFLFSSTAFAQQEYVPRYDAFAGFSYLNSSPLNLAERGFNAQFGINVTRWLALGADYSIFTGHSDIRGQ